MKKKFKKILPVLIALILIVFPFGGLKAFAYTGGLLDGKPINIGKDANSTTATTNYITDNNKGTTFNLNTTGTSYNVAWYKFTDDFTITSYKMYTTSATNKVNIFFYDSANSLIYTVNNADVTDNSVSINVPNVRKVAVQNPAGSAVIGLAEFDVFGHAPIVHDEITNLNASVKNNNVTLNYSIPSSNSNFTGSKIYRDGVLIATQNATANSFTDSRLNWETNYTYKVTATYSDGYETQGITTAATIPIEPTYPSVGSLDYTTNYNSISFSWENPSDISGVNIYRDGNLIKTLAATETSFTDSNLTPETAYTYKFTVTYSDGRKSEEKTIKATTTAEPKPVLSGVDYSQNGSGEYVFTWTEPTQGQVKVLIDGQEYQTVDAALKQVTIPKENMKLDKLGNPLVSMVPVSLSGKVGEYQEVKGKNLEIPFDVKDLILSGSNLLWYVAPFLLLALAFLLVPKLRNLVFAAFKGTKEERAAEKEKREAEKEKRRTEKQERQKEVRERSTARETREPREKVAKEERKPRETRESRIQREPRETRERRN